ncbi:inositol polyphosphate 1-phosphatase isoform X1 [Prinia subflava]|uniref:inositol polyphosphate 1-phosphatase isoform X1 n=1 Tax=Prinia subflava TaxID=208062 RepID=UPI002FE0B395
MSPHPNVPTAPLPHLRSFRILPGRVPDPDRCPWRVSPLSPVSPLSRHGGAAAGAGGGVAEGGGGGAAVPGGGAAVPAAGGREDGPRQERALPARLQDAGGCPDPGAHQARPGDTVPRAEGTHPWGGVKRVQGRGGWHGDSVGLCHPGCPCATPVADSGLTRGPAGGTVTVQVGATPGDTAALLLAVLGPEQARAAELLAEAVHREVTLEDTELADIEPGVCPGDLGIWIDPIDSTNEFIRGCEDVAAVDGVAPGGLRSALVLVGAFDRHTGVPVLGVINEPFFQRDPQTGRWQGRYHWGVAHGDTRLCSLSPPAPRPRPCVVLSRAEAPAVRGALGLLGGGPPLLAAGAGYKLLCVALGLADAFVLSRATTFAWDSCGPHAILRALGGGVVALEGALRARRDGGGAEPPELRYHRPRPGRAGAERWANPGGLVAFVHPQHLRAVLDALRDVPGL